MSSIQNLNQVNKNDTVFIKGEGDNYKPIKVAMVVDNSVIKYIVSDEGTAFFLKDGLYKA